MVYKISVEIAISNINWWTFCCFLADVNNVADVIVVADVVVCITSH